MILYCLVENGVIKDGPRRLPALWYGYDLAGLSEVERAALGWLPTNVVRGVGFSAPEVHGDRVTYALDVSGLKIKVSHDVYRDFLAAEAGEFSSSALGEPHLYRTELDARLDLLGAGVLGTSIDYSCRRASDGVKASFTHTAAQMAQVLSEGAAWREWLVRRLNEKLAAIEAATTADAVLAISF